MRLKSHQQSKRLKVQKPIKFNSTYQIQTKKIKKNRMRRKETQKGK